MQEPPVLQEQMPDTLAAPKYYCYFDYIIKYGQIVWR